MALAKMHDGEIGLDIDLVQRLIATQFPNWSIFPLTPVLSHGTDHALFRLGADMVVRLPRIQWATGQLELERVWLPRLAPHLPLAVPEQLALGEPGEGYPWRWGVYRWLEGENAVHSPVANSIQAAEDLAQFIRALQVADPAGGPQADATSGGRGAPLVARDADTRRAIAESRGLLDIAAVAAAWETALCASAYDGPPVWIHGDLEPGNLLVHGGRLSAVIDFCCLCLGDPACDLIPAWSFFSGKARAVFRSALGVDDATWVRGKGWALSTAMIALPYYKDTNPVLADGARRKIEAVLNE